MNEPINVSDLGLDSSFELIERLANALEEVNKLTEKLQDEGLPINFTIELK